MNNYQSLSYATLFCMLFSITSIQAVNTFFSENKNIPHSWNLVPFAPSTQKARDASVNTSFFYTESNAKKGLGSYFFPNNNNELSIAGLAAAKTGDISSTWLNVAGVNPEDDNGALFQNAYSSRITIKPTSKRYGLVTNIYKELNLNVPFWISIQLPFVHAERNLNLVESSITNNYANFSNIPTFGVAATGSSSINYSTSSRERANLPHFLTAASAFANPMWQYGKLSDNKISINGLADITLKIGKHFKNPLLSDNFINLWASLVIPTGDKPSQEFMFAPVVGNNHHVGAGLGACCKIPLTNKKSFLLSLVNEFDYSYLFANNQYRMFDLTNGALSRYETVAKVNNANAEVLYVEPAINYFTRKCSVTPNHQITSRHTIMGEGKQISFQCGYQLWFRNAEKLSITDNITNNLIVAYRRFKDGEPFLIQAFNTAKISDSGISLVDGSSVGGSTATGTNQTPVTSATYLANNNFNLESGKAPSAFTHGPICSISTEKIFTDKIIKGSLGGSYSFADSSSGQSEWSVQASLSFII